MQPRVPEVLTLRQPEFPAVASHSTLRRRTFAEWVVAADNPLAARVLVNRVWQFHFGTGLVATSSDFGQIGSRPTHPDLLDWLAHWLMHDAGWSMKALHRLILTSETYRQSSHWLPVAANVDPENKRLWRFPYRRLDIEAIRDSMLTVSGALNAEMFGPAVYLPIADVVVEAHTDKQSAWKKSSEPAIHRRTIYAFIKRTLLVPMLETFDYCDTTQSTDRRAITSVAPQAITLMNGDFVNQQAELLARRLAREGGSEFASQIRLAYRLAFSREPSRGETETLRQFLEQEIASQRRGVSGEGQEAEAGYHRALVQVCRALLNLNEFVYPN